MEKSEIFESELSMIKAEPLRSIVRNFLNDEVPAYFWEVAASSTGKYHPWYSLGYGGLVRHTKAAVKIANDLLALEQYSDLPHDEIIAALILHDTFKHGMAEDNVEHTVFNHPAISAAQFEEYLEDAENFLVDSRDMICSLIESHMGQWNVKDQIELPKPITKSQQFVHMCDYLASRKFITVEVE